MKSVFNFDSSREYLRAYIDSLPKKGWGEIQRWADHLGLQASYISQVLSGHKAFNSDQGLKLARHLGLKEAETDYLMILMESERAGSFETKRYYSEKLKSFRSEARELAKRLPKDRVFSEVEKSIFYSSWIYSAIRLYCSLNETGKRLEDITEKFQITRAEALKYLDFLCDSGLCVKKGAHYKVGARQTALESSSPHIHRHRQNWRLKALSQIEKTQADELVFSAPFSISPEDFEQLREEIAVLIENFYKRVKATDPQEMAVLNIDLMRLR